ncbi:protein kinase family protein [Brevibacterium siliguriense]|uniref:aminoglycoside phosphotransferase n=1 Tax=Brevibacterium siliguriense TaxID=1136497 RepID=UPI001E3A8754|nr:aminoglycoside phosphotransferase [Brevibacterium siliguriense]
MDTKALKLTAIAATMLDGFVPTSWTPLPPLDAGVRVLLDDGDQQLVATAQTQLDRTADIGSSAEAGRIYEAMYPHADFVWPRLRAITEVDADYFDTASPTTVTLADPLPGAPLGDVPIADTARASSLAQALATLHSTAPEPVSDAGFPVEDPSRSQFLILERLDQAASTGRVPSSLLQHWEEEFEKVALWHFLATPIHGSIDETSVYTDQERVLALAEIGRLRVADPAIDLAAASALIDPAALPTFYEEYRNSRPRADEHVIARAELLAEFAVLDWLLEAVDSGDETAVLDAAALLSSFNDVLFGSSSDGTAAQGPDSDSASADHAASREGTTSAAATAGDAPDVEAAITESAAADVFIPGAQAASDDDSEFGSEPGSQVRTEPTWESDETDDGDDTGRIR